MAKKLYEESKIIAIANAIRKKGGVGTWTTEEMPEAIKNLPFYKDFNITDFLVEVFNGTLDPVILPEGVTKIDAPKIQIVSPLPSTITYVNLAYWPDSEIKEKIEFPEGITEFYGSSPFGGARPYNQVIKEIVFPESTETLSSYVISGTPNLEKITLKGKLTSIPNGAFRSCPKLKTVDIIAPVETINSYAFQSCGSLENLTIPTTVTELKEYALGNIGNNAYIDGQSVFQCALNKISILNGAAIKSTSTYCCSGNGQNNNTTVGVKEIEIGDGCTTIPKRFASSNGALRTVTFTDSVKIIDENAFSGCKSLENLNLHSVEEIKSYAFQNTKLTSLIIPDTCTAIGTMAFAYTDLEEIYLPSTIETIGSNALSVNDKANLVINCGFSEGAVSGAPWGATGATINYDVSAPTAE